MLNEIELLGCAPEPLMSYLKALGVFRLVAEQKDPTARLSWRGGIPVLHTTLDRESLMKFFIDEYAPTPVIAPWGARSGFYSGSSESTARAALDSIVNTTATRFASFRTTIALVRECLAQLDITNKKDLETEENYLRLLRLLRNELPDEGHSNSSLSWFEAVCAITLDDRRFPPLLGTGGNEGSGSYVSTFSQLVGSLLIDHDSESGVGGALFNDFGARVQGVTVGHFDPGALGGPNGTQGFSGGGGSNPWDYLIGIEGTILFAGSVSRRLGNHSTAKAVFPFCVDPVAVGYGTESDVEAGNSTRAEMWLPLWNLQLTLPEVKQLLAEGRAELGRRQARNAVEFALAIASLGVNRGISTFVRYAFVMRYGLSYFAAPLGHIEVKARPNARLLDDPPLRDWIDRLRRACNDKEKTPARYQSALRNLDRSYYSFATRSEIGNDAAYFVDVLRSIGNAERTMARGISFAKAKFIRPLFGLNAQWLRQANDGSAEFRLAASLAGIRNTNKNEVGPIRAFLEEVEVTKYVNWNPGSTSAIWSKQPLARNLAAIFQRRQMNAYRTGIQGVPIRSSCFARLDDVIDFLQGNADDDKIADLLWGLICVELPEEPLRSERSFLDVPFEFGLPRLLVNSRCIVASGGHWNIDREGAANAIHDPDVFHQLTTGRRDAVSLCVTRAARRLKSGGLVPVGYRNRRHTGQALAVASEFDPTRLLASMLFPLSDHDLERISNTVLYPVETEASHVD
jgi:CRISPR-associated protein Csx17